MRRLNWKRESVDRLFRLNHTTRLEQFDVAFSAPGRQVEISSSKQAAFGDIDPSLGMPRLSCMLSHMQGDPPTSCEPHRGVEGHRLLLTED
jgi:hypothetical protein